MINTLTDVTPEVLGDIAAEQRLRLDVEGGARELQRALGAEGREGRNRGFCRHCARRGVH